MSARGCTCDGRWECEACEAEAERAEREFFLSEEAARLFDSAGGLRPCAGGCGGTVDAVAGIDTCRACVDRY